MKLHRVQLSVHASKLSTSSDWTAMMRNIHRYYRAPPLTTLSRPYAPLSVTTRFRRQSLALASSAEIQSSPTNWFRWRLLTRLSASPLSRVKNNQRNLKLLPRLMLKMDQKASRLKASVKEKKRAAILSKQRFHSKGWGKNKSREGTIQMWRRWSWWQAIQRALQITMLTFKWSSIPRTRTQSVTLGTTETHLKILIWMNIQSWSQTMTASRISSQVELWWT